MRVERSTDEMIGINPVYLPNDVLNGTGVGVVVLLSFEFGAMVSCRC